MCIIIYGSVAVNEDLGRRGLGSLGYGVAIASYFGDLMLKVFY